MILRHRIPALLLALVAAAAIAACDDSETHTRETTTNPETGEPVSNAPPLPASTTKESIEGETRRISETASEKDCDKVNKLNLLRRKTLDNPSRCKYLKRIAGLEVSGSESFKDAAGVVEFARGENTISATVLVDEDGRYHVDFIDPFLGEPSVGTELAEEFDQTVDEAVDALGSGDCEAYRAVAYRRFGIGALPRDKVCAYVADNPIGNLLESFPDAEPELIGGNAAYAFYGLAGPSVHYTLVLARQTEGGVAAELPREVRELPPDAAEYGFVDAYPTNLREPGEQPEQD